jgi:hypothetical protein
MQQHSLKVTAFALLVVASSQQPAAALVHKARSASIFAPPQIFSLRGPA